MRLNRREFDGLLAALAAAGITRSFASEGSRLNILWVNAEDLGPQLGCYGYPLVRTPNLDRLAAEGIRFTRAFTAAPVCSPSRSSFNTGMYQTTIGAHDHRSHRDDGYRLPAGVRLIPDYFREQGYFTANVLEIAPALRGTGKTDFNFFVEKPYDGTHWNQRRPGQPFFAHINFQATHKGPAFVAARKQKELVDPAKVPLPPYYPDHPVVRDEVANYLDTVNLLDTQIGALLRLLEEEGQAKNTAVVFFGDNGRCLLRGKQWLYDAGIHVPLIIRWPGGEKHGWKPGTVVEDLVSAIDLAATTLRMAGIAVPETMQGRPLAGPGARRREVIFAARDRCDMTVDKIRCARDQRYKYIRNLMPERPYTQYNEYIERQYPTLRVLQELHAQRKLDRVQELFLQPRKPPEEFYDTLADPHEVNNLAASPQHRKIREALSRKLDAWLAEADRTGSVPTSSAASRTSIPSVPRRPVVSQLVLPSEEKYPSR